MTINIILNISGGRSDFFLKDGEVAGLSNVVQRSSGQLRREGNESTRNRLMKKSLATLEKSWVEMIRINVQRAVLAYSLIGPKEVQAIKILKMSSDSECSESEVGEQSTNFRFVEALANHKVLFGKSITLKQLKKKIQNTKKELKKNTDKKATGNTKIIRKDWEKKLLEIIDGDVQNPVFHKIPRAVSMGFAGKQHLRDDNSTYVPFLPPMPATRPIPPPP
ncbi:hypothetical protein JTB14_023504 [Gonioctena quinquepunctata]|nr:hypothetical protein JTB14_023504 [Gonioctena quinquepunctata]